MFKKVKIFLAISLLLVFSFSASVFSEDKFEIKIVGPSSAPNIKGPSIAAPTKADIDEMKRKAGHEEFIVSDNEERGGVFFQAFFDWFFSLFKN